MPVKARCQSKSVLMTAEALQGSKGPQMMNIRMMFPFTMVCDSCKEYNYTGTVK